MVEVKGPGDRLSTKQILWLDYFVAVGVSAEVCYVKGELLSFFVAINNPKIRIRQRDLFLFLFGRIQSTPFKIMFQRLEQNN